MDFQAIEGGAGCCILEEELDYNMGAMLVATQLEESDVNATCSSCEESDLEDQVESETEKAVQCDSVYDLTNFEKMVKNDSEFCGQEMMIEEVKADKQSVLCLSPKSERSRNKEIEREINKQSQKKYSPEIKLFLKNNNIQCNFFKLQNFSFI